MIPTVDIWNSITKNGDNIIIASHHTPDGDGVGAVFALAQALCATGLRPKVILDKYNKKLDIVRGREFIYHGDIQSLPCDVFVALDCGDISRVAAPDGLFKRAPITINIDHHINNGNFATYNYVDVAASSTCEAVFDIIKMFVPISKDIAEAIYMGIVTDTGGFRFSSTTDKTMEIIAKLMRAGINFSKIQQETIYNRNKVQIAIYTRAMQNLRYTESGIAYTTLTQEELKENGAEYLDLNNIVENILNIDGIRVSVFLTERDTGFTKASFRSHDVDVNAVARVFGGGGHKFAAAAGFEAPFNDGVKQILEALEEAISNHHA